MSEQAELALNGEDEFQRMIDERKEENEMRKHTFDSLTKNGFHFHSDEIHSNLSDHTFVGAINENLSLSVRKQLAEFIVRACNSHKELLDRLKENTELLSDFLKPVDDMNTVVKDYLDFEKKAKQQVIYNLAALAKAKGE